jgi:hypothetical protein
MPMKPVAPERTPPTTKPIAVWVSSAIARTIAITTPMIPMIWYWRDR